MKLTVTVFLVCLIGAGVVRGQAAKQVVGADDPVARYMQDIEQRMRAVPLTPTAENFLKQHTQQSWINNAWVNESQTRYTYDGDRLTEVLSLTWEGGQWQNATRATHTYSGDQIAVQVYEQWENGDWEPTYRYSYSYQGGAIQELVTEVWSGSSWENESRSRYTTASGSVASWEYEDWDGTDWVLTERAEVTEDNGDLTFTYQEFEGGSWVNTERTIYINTTYQDLLDTFAEIQQAFEAFIGFGLGFRLPDSIEQEWDGTQWVDVSRQLTEYDQNDRPVYITYEDWEDGSWVGTSRQELAYDGGGQLTSTSLQSFDEGAWQTYLVESYTYEDDVVVEVLHEYDLGGGLMNASLITLEWTQTPTAAERTELPDAVKLDPVYPNPFNPSAKITYRLETAGPASIRVYDALGRTVATLVDRPHAAGAHDVAFEAADLPSGVYVVRLQAGSVVRTQLVTLSR